MERVPYCGSSVDCGLALVVSMAGSGCGKSSLLRVISGLGPSVSGKYGAGGFRVRQEFLTACHQWTVA